MHQIYAEYGVNDGILSIYQMSKQNPLTLHLFALSLPLLVMLVLCLLMRKNYLFFT